MATVHSESLKNAKMNSRGADYHFDKDGICKDVPFEVAKLMAPMHGFKLDPNTLSKEEMVEVMEHVATINAARSGERALGHVFVQGQPQPGKEHAHTFVMAPAAGRVFNKDTRKADPGVDSGKLGLPVEKTEEELPHHETKAEIKTHAKEDAALMAEALADEGERAQDAEDEESAAAGDDEASGEETSEETSDEEEVTPVSSPNKIKGKKKSKA